MKKLLSIFLVVATLLSFTGCANSKAKDNGQITGTIRVAYQFGLTYAPFYVMQEKNLLDKYLPGVKVEWTQLASGAVVGESLAANKIDIGVQASAPFLALWDKGVKVKLLSGLNCSPLGLVTTDENVKGLSDISKTNKIAVPAPNSIHAILLSMAAKEELGDPHALDNNYVAMAHPDAMAALMNKINLSGHYATAPYLYEEIDQGGKLIADAYDAFGGDFSFTVAVATESFMKEKPLFAAAFYMALSDAIQMVNDKQDDVLDIIMKKENLSREKAIKYLDWEGTNYSTTTYGLMGLAKYMNEQGYIKNLPKNTSDILWPTASAIVGQRAGGPSVVEQAQERK